RPCPDGTELPGGGERGRRQVLPRLGGDPLRRHPVLPRRDSVGEEVAANPHLREGSSSACPRSPRASGCVAGRCLPRSSSSAAISRWQYTEATSTSQTMSWRLTWQARFAA